MIFDAKCTYIYTEMKKNPLRFNAPLILYAIDRAHKDRLYGIRPRFFSPRKNAYGKFRMNTNVIPENEHYKKAFRTRKHTHTLPTNERKLTKTIVGNFLEQESDWMKNAVCRKTQTCIFSGAGRRLFLPVGFSRYCSRRLTTVKLHDSSYDIYLSIFMLFGYHVFK